MLRWIAVAMVVILTVGSIGWCQDTDAKAGWYFLNGMQWSGIEVENGHWGYYMGSGRWFNFAPSAYFITPVALQVGLSGDDSEAMLSFTPQVVLKLGQFLVSASPGFSNLYADNNVVTYGKLESSLTWMISPLWNVDEDGRKIKKAHAGGLTLAFQYMPGNKHKALMLGFTIVN